jgi:hypothetical protein
MDFQLPVACLKASPNASMRFRHDANRRSIGGRRDSQRSRRSGALLSTQLALNLSVSLRGRNACCSVPRKDPAHVSAASEGGVLLRFSRVRGRP